MFVFCMALWMVLNGRFTWEILLIGAAVSAAVSLGFRKMTGTGREQELSLIRKLPKMFDLFGYLVKEILLANLRVIRMVFRKKQPDSCLVSITPRLHTTAARVALADCITLTPGTITADIQEGSLTVHCLDGSMAEGLEDSGFVCRLQAMENRSGNDEV